MSAPLAALVLLLAAPSLSASESAPPAFMAFIDALDRAEPIDPQKLQQLVGRPLNCKENHGRADCEDHDVRIGEVVVGELSLRYGAFGSILLLERLSGACVPADALERRFGPARLDEGCTDGVTCWYREIKRPWGVLDTGLGDDLHAPCAKSIIANRESPASSTQTRHP
jgi:hypothetical protein